MNKFPLSPKQNVYLTIACLVLILASQAYVLNDYFQTTRAGLVRETNAIIEEAFRSELNHRLSSYKHSIGEDTITALPPEPIDKSKAPHIDLRKSKNYKEDILKTLDKTINKFVSEFISMNLNQLDSISKVILKKRNIQSSFVIRVIETKTGKLLQQSKATTTIPILQLSSVPLSVDFNNRTSLQLVLINPFVPLFQRMGVVLLVSILLSIICFIAIWVQFSTLLRQKQLVVFKNDFLATIAHELKRPVASLAFNLDSLKMPSLNDKPEFREKLINRSLSATTELNATIQMIVALSKVEEGILKLQEESIDLKLLFEELKNRFMAQASKAVRIELQCADKILLCRGDVQLLQQCFANLIDNAIKYSENEVLIVISLQQSGSWVVVSIKDNGLGIPDEKLPLIFDKYARVHTSNTKVNGFGIGLNYVKTIVEKHQGEVKVSSVVGKGSEFRVMLPKIIDN